MATRQIQSLLPSAARTATGQSGAIDTSTADQANIYVNVTAASGTTPTLVVDYQTSPDGTNWYTHTSTASLTTTGQTLIKASGNIGRKSRVNYTIGGTTPSFTFTVDVEGINTASVGTVV